MDMSTSIEPRSDQWNADDLLMGPRTVTIASVSVGAAEQPFDFHLVETPDRVYRPSKTMRRVIMAGWGAETDVYPGRRLTLYREPTIRFGKDECGGIRVSHMSHIDGPLKLALTVSRGKRDPFVVQPLVDAPSVAMSTRDQQQRIGQLLDAAGIADKAGYVSNQVARTIATSKDLTRDEAATVIGVLEGEK